MYYHAAPPRPVKDGYWVKGDDGRMRFVQRPDDDDEWARICREQQADASAGQAALHHLNP